MELSIERLGKTARDTVPSKVGLGTTRSGKTRKGEAQRRKIRQDRVRHGLSKVRL